MGDIASVDCRAQGMGLRKTYGGKRSAREGYDKRSCGGLATDCPPGCSRMVITPEENGLLVPVGDEKAMAAAINRLIEDRELAERLGRNAAKIGEKAGAETIFREWEQYILELRREL